MLYNLNAWLQLFHREPDADIETRPHTTLAVARLRFLFIAARIWNHAGRAGIHYSDHYQEQGLFQRLMDRLQRITHDARGWMPVVDAAFG
jgi:hypothetical protein